MPQICQDLQSHEPRIAKILITESHSLKPCSKILDRRNQINLRLVIRSKSSEKIEIYPVRPFVRLSVFIDRDLYIRDYFCHSICQVLDLIIPVVTPDIDCNEVAAIAGVAAAKYFHGKVLELDGGLIL